MLVLIRHQNRQVDTDANHRTIVISPPPSAITPSVTSSSSDLCTVGVAGAVQTQILGISSGETVRDPNCERLKIVKTLYDMGMKVAAVSVLMSGSQSMGCNEYGWDTLSILR